MMNRNLALATMATVALLTPVATAEGPTTDERVAVLEARIVSLEQSLSTVDDIYQEVLGLAERTSAAVNLGRCITGVEGVRKQWVNLNGKRVRVIVDDPDLHPAKGVTYLAEIHPDCVRDTPNTKEHVLTVRGRANQH
jgi:hypothetical protein